MRVLVLVISCLVPRMLEGQDSIPARNRALVALIDRFLAAPQSNADLWRAIAESAQVRSDVTVELTPQVAPWLCTSRKTTPDRQALSQLLVGAYIAGNMRHQLVTGAKRDEPRAGMESVVNVYRAVSGRVFAFKDLTAEEWMVADSLGTLPALADTLGRIVNPMC